MREAFGYHVKSVSDHAHKELQPQEVYDIFRDNYGQHRVAAVRDGSPLPAEAGHHRARHPPPTTAKFTRSPRWATAVSTRSATRCTRSWATTCSTPTPSTRSRRAPPRRRPPTSASPTPEGQLVWGRGHPQRHHPLVHPCAGQRDQPHAGPSGRGADGIPAGLCRHTKLLKGTRQPCNATAHKLSSKP